MKDSAGLGVADTWYCCWCSLLVCINACVCVSVNASLPHWLWIFWFNRLNNKHIDNTLLFYSIYRHFQMHFPTMCMFLKFTANFCNVIAKWKPLEQTYSKSQPRKFRKPSCILFTPSSPQAWSLPWQKLEVYSSPSNTLVLPSPALSSSPTSCSLGSLVSPYPTQLLSLSCRCLWNTAFKNAAFWINESFFARCRWGRRGGVVG